MGGSTGAGNVTAAAEFNIYCDPEAAWVVFNSGVPIRMVGLNVTRRTGFNHADIEICGHPGVRLPQASPICWRSIWLANVSGMVLTLRPCTMCVRSSPMSTQHCSNTCTRASISN